MIESDEILNIVSILIGDDELNGASQKPKISPLLLCVWKI